jgi:hypothetical protein
MDAQDSWNQLCDAWAKEEWDRMKTLATDLINHVQAGGPPPHVLGRSDLGKSWDEVLTRAACAYVLDRFKNTGTPGSKFDLLPYLRGYTYFDN